MEEAINQLEERQQAILAEIEEQQRILLQLQDQIVKSFLPESHKSPRCWRCWNWLPKVKMWRKLPKTGLGAGEVELILELNKGEKPLLKAVKCAILASGVQIHTPWDGR